MVRSQGCCVHTCETMYSCKVPTLPLRAVTRGSSCRKRAAAGMGRSKRNLCCGLCCVGAACPRALQGNACWRCSLACLAGVVPCMDPVLEVWPAGGASRPLLVWYVILGRWVSSVRPHIQVLGLGSPKHARVGAQLVGLLGAWVLAVWGSPMKSDVAAWTARMRLRGSVCATVPQVGQSRSGEVVSLD